MMRPLPVRPLALAALTLVLVAATASAAPVTGASRPYERTLDNGLRVVVISQPRLAIVQVQLLVPGGSAADPVGQEGAAALTAQMLKRGTTSRSADAYAADVDRLGGSIGAQATREFSTLSGSFLARDLGAGLELMSNAVLDPIFPEDELQRLRVQTYRLLVQSRGNPAAVADEQVWNVAMGAHPYRRPVLGTTRSLGSISRETLRAYHRDVWRPDHATLIIAGDVTPERGVALAADWFGRWTGHATPVATALAPAPPTQPRLALVDLPGMGWAEVRLALVVPGRREGGDAIALAANAFAGGPGARLSRLTGGIAGALPRGGMSTFQQGGLMVVSLAVPADSAAVAVRRLRAELRAFAQAPPTEAELGPLRRTFTAAFPISFETLGGAIAQWQSALLQGLTPDEVARTPDRVAAVSATDMATTVKRWFDPQHALVLVVGPADRLRARLQALGALEEVAPDPLVPLASRTVADTLAPATPERVARARSLVARALEAHGGAAVLRGVRDSEVLGAMSLTMSGREIAGQTQQIRKDPYRMVVTTQFMAISTRQVLDGTRGWLQDDPDSAAVSADSLAVAAMRSTFTTDLPHLLLSAADSATTVAWRGPGRLGAIETDQVDVLLPSGERRRYHFERSTGRLAGLDQYGSADPDAQVVAQRTYSGFQPVDGVLWPFQEVRRTSGDNSMRLDVKSVRLNLGVPDATFERPTPSR